ncbi:AraC family transcriptional regulator [Olivibacter sp. CPCC 100613]|uniref:helix-turn-helix transcriptional regulator n=1 Tax=Olivibacter sp. CPCC 100613 TaxID=3079931 RepID=UPI002FFA2018
MMDYKLDVGDLAEMYALGKSEITVSKDRADKFFHFSKGKVSFKEERLRNEVIMVQGAYHFNDNIELTGSGDAPLLEMQFNLSPSSIFYENKLSKSPFVAPMSGNIMFDAENGKAKIGFKKDIAYHTFDLHLPTPLLLQYEGECKEMDHFLDAIDKGKSRLLSDPPIRVSPKILSVIDDMRQCHYTGITRRIYLEAKVYELIALSFNKLNNAHETLTLSSYDKERILLAGQLIRENVGRPHTIQELGNLVGINRNKLKQGFKVIFDTTPFAYLQEIRMNQAKQYLLDTDLPLQEISMLLGYNNLSNFSAAFKRIVGHPPTKFRK